MTHVGDSANLESAADSLERFGPIDPVPQQLVPDDAARVKAIMVLRALSDAGLREPYGFNREDAVAMWAAALGEWIQQPGTEWPSLGDVVAMARGAQLEAEAQQRSHNPRTCSLCDDLHWVKVVDGVVHLPAKLTPKQLLELERTGEPWPTIAHEQYHMRPCPQCPSMARRSELYDAHHLGREGHFSMEHQDKGGCSECWPYTDPPRHRRRERAASRR
jgi:hypothetical protein